MARKRRRYDDESDFRRRRRRSYSNSLSPSPPPPACLRKKRREDSYLKMDVGKFIADLTLVERKVWVGNLNMTNLDEPQLQEVFTNACKAYGITRERPIQSIWLSKEKNFCFVEFRNIRDAEVALSSWRSVVIPELGQQPLPVGPPRERTTYSDDLLCLKDYVYGEEMPRSWTTDQLRTMRDMIKNKSRKDNSFEERYRFTHQRTRGEINIPIPGHGSFLAQTQNPNATMVLKIKLRKSARKKESDEEGPTTSVIEEAKRQIKRSKNFLNLKEPKEGDEDEALFALFRDVDSAIQAKEKLTEALQNHFRVKFCTDKVFDAKKAKSWGKMRKMKTSENLF